VLVARFVGIEILLEQRRGFPKALTLTGRQSIDRKIQSEYLRPGKVSGTQRLREQDNPSAVAVS
jgi:hypothetical protein